MKELAVLLQSAVILEQSVRVIVAEGAVNVLSLKLLIARIQRASMAPRLLNSLPQLPLLLEEVRQSHHRQQRC